jgi:hypothetical protein
LSRLLLHFGALAAADVVSQTLLLKLVAEDEVAAVAQMMQRPMVNEMQLLLAARR